MINWYIKLKVCVVQFGLRVPVNVFLIGELLTVNCYMSNIGEIIESKKLLA